MKMSACVKVCCLAIALTGIWTAAKADEEKVALNDLPKVITESVKKRFPNAELVSAEKEIEDGKTLYEVAIKDKDHKIDITTTADGTITEIEKELAAADLPKAVTAAINGKYSQSKFKKIEEITHVKAGKESLEYYEVLLVTKDQKKFEVTCTAAGKLLKEEDKNKEE